MRKETFCCDQQMASYTSHDLVDPTQLQFGYSSYAHDPEAFVFCSLSKQLKLRLSSLSVREQHTARFCAPCCLVVCLSPHRFGSALYRPPGGVIQPRTCAVGPLWTRLVGYLEGLGRRLRSTQGNANALTGTIRCEPKLDLEPMKAREKILTYFRS